ncbi:putative Programmed cell death protein 5 [Hypsibius exemplaris]|uniref:Programmed cell death protein 5 n=1 Tax=Hypsibius exemplaris TaxID=2072580 RepID=A0A1W0WB38_HYPEX|nr:putative Programmed cell death protein 5 [Hypsibius exemplaris]
MDDDLEAIRAQRMAQLRRQNPGALGATPGAGEADQNQQNAQERQKQEEEMRHSILAQVLDQSARARLNTIALAKPEKARMVESIVIQMATRGQLGGKLSEEQFKQILSRVSEQTHQETTVKFDRRRNNIDDEDF